MATIKPFRGILFNKPANSLIAPPYDVIDEHYKRQLESGDEHNIVRIILPDDYDKAAELLNAWLSSGILKFDSHCNYYIYQAQYSLFGQTRTLKGFIGALRLEPLGGCVKPHEKTLKGPKIDRFNLITRTHASFCPIVGLYGPNRQIAQHIDEVTETTNPVIDLEFEGIRHRLYRDPDSLFGEGLKGSDIIIADGHHRYETALMIQEHFRKQGIVNGGFDYIMSLFVDAENGGLSLLAIHRLVKRVDNPSLFMERLKEFFELRRLERATLHVPRHCDFVMYFDKSFYCLSLRQKRSADPIRSLDVSVFEEIVYKRILGLSDDDIRLQRTAGYAHSPEELIRAVDENEAQAGFILKPMKFEDLMLITSKGLTVPQKSTFFFPKIPSGLVGYHFDSIKGCEGV